MSDFGEAVLNPDRLPSSSSITTAKKSVYFHNAQIFTHLDTRHYTINMNTKISISDSLDNHLIILSDNHKLDWAAQQLQGAEEGILSNGLVQEMSSFVFPRAGHFVFVQILKENGNESIAREDVRLAAAEMQKTLAHYKIPSVTVLDTTPGNRALDYAEGLILSSYQFLKYFSDPKAKENKLKEVKLHQSSVSQADFNLLAAQLEGTCKARDLVNEPHSYLNAPTFSKEVEQAGKTYGFSTEILHKEQIEELGMGGLLAVNMGSFIPPTFNIMEWKPKDAKNSQPIVLVGKGVMFDTGGVSLKPTKNSMDYMKCDMGGSATVLGTMIAVAKAELPVHLVGLVAATDNRPGKDAYLPGDVVKTMSGITVEILNTDAEGRMTLADALHYAKRYRPELVLDYATLTGAAAYSIGPEGIVYMGNASEEVKKQLEESGHRTYERMVEFPMFREYGETIKSDIADIKNLGGPYAGMVTAGMFLQHFTDYPWVHMDIAGPAYLHKKSGYRTKEGTGVGVRLTFDFLQHYIAQKAVSRAAN